MCVNWFLKDTYICTASLTGELCLDIFKVGTRVINLHGICVFKFLTATLLKNLRRIRHCVPVMCVNNYNRPTKSCARNISIFEYSNLFLQFHISIQK